MNDVSITNNNYDNINQLEKKIFKLLIGIKFYRSKKNATFRFK